MAAMLMTTIGCERENSNFHDDIDLNEKIISVTGIGLPLTSLTMVEGNSYILEYVIFPNNATNQEVMWASSRPEIAGVSSEGILEARKAGACIITVTTKEGNLKATCNVNVISSCGIIALHIGEITEIKLCETACNSQYNLSLHIEYINDSRCPSEAICIWGGNAYVRFHLTTSKGAYDFTLDTNQSVADNKIDTVIEGIKYKLLDVLPYPKFGEQPIQTAKIFIEEASKQSHIPVEDGIYTGIFNVTYFSYFSDIPESWVKRSGETTLELKNGKYTCMGNSNRIPAGGSGTYSINDNKIVFKDENWWTADFDWYLVLNGAYYYQYDGSKLKISAANTGRYYEYNLEKTPEYVNATVLGRGLDCGNIFLIQFDDDVKGLPFPVEAWKNMYYAINLPEEYKIEGARITVKISFISDTEDEALFCTAMGPGYPAIYIVSVR